MMKRVTTLLKASYSEEGSNHFQYEKAAYGAFIKYLKEVNAGRRENVSLEKILVFVTGAEDEPPLGFSIHPSITFVESQSFLPTASTCVNKLNLTRPSMTNPLPSQELLFQLYDYAFVNSYFGLK